MGCAPSKKNAEVDPDDKPYSPKDKKKPGGKSKGGKDGDVVYAHETSPEHIEEPKVVPSTQTSAPPPKHDANANTTARPNSTSSGDKVDATSPFNGPVRTTKPNGDVIIHDQPKLDRLHFLGQSLEGAPPKPRRSFHTPDRRVNWTDDDVMTRRSGDDNSAYFTFPRSRPPRRAQSMRERCYIVDEKEEVPSDGLVSLREKTIERRKDLDYCSSAVYLGNTVSPPGRGRKILRLEFMSPEKPATGTYIPHGNVREMAQSYQRMTQVLNTPPPPPVRSPKPEDGDKSLEDALVAKEDEGEDRGEEDGGSGGEERKDGEGKEEEEKEEEEEGEKVSIIEKVNKELFPDYVRPARETPEREEEADGGVDPAQQGAQQEDRFYNNKAFEKPDIDPADPQQQDAALRIQTKYRQHHAKQEVQSKREENAAIKLQAGARGMKDRKRVAAMRSEADVKSQAAADEADRDDKEQETAAAEAQARAEEEEALKKQEAEEVDIDLEDPEVAAAATKIQAGFKGFKARKEVQELKGSQSGAADAPPSGGDEEQVDLDLDDPEVAAAATKIQAGFKGYKARKDFTATKEAKQSEQRQEEHEAAGSEQGEADATASEHGEADVTATEQEADVKTTGDTDSSPAEQKDEEQPEQSQDVTESEDVKDAPKEDDGDEAAAVKEDAKDEGDAKEEGDDKDKDAVAEPADDANEKPEEEAGDIDMEDPEVAAAATKIQAGFKGMKARKEVKGMKEGKEKEEEPKQEGEEPKQEGEEPSPDAEDSKKEEEVDIDLEDPEVQAAAEKIQAGFKGMKARKEVKEMKGSKQEGEESTQEGEESKQEGEESKQEGEEPKEEGAENKDEPSDDEKKSD